MSRAFKVLICDPIGLARDELGRPDISGARRHIERLGGRFIPGSHRSASELEPGVVHFFYLPELAGEEAFLEETEGAGYDAVIAAATIVPPAASFSRGAVRIGSGTGNMRSHSWGGPDGRGGEAVLMNMPGINARATAHMVMKAILRELPDLPVEELHDRVVAGTFDTARHLGDYPTSGLAGRRIAVLGYGNIGREVAQLASAFRMEPIVYARPRYRRWIESEGFAYAATPVEAAAGADVLSCHVGFGPIDPATGRPANAGVIGEDVLGALNPGAVVINFDRGELADTEALARALADDRVSRVAVDADIFLDKAGNPSGPLAPYLQLARRWPDRVRLLPHAAADTDHPSRVAGACLAIDMIFGLLERGEAYNVVGDVPAGVRNCGRRKPAGIGNVTREIVTEALARRAEIEELTESLEGLAVYCRRALAEGGRPGDAAELAEAIFAGNRVATLLDWLGLTGPCPEEL